MQCLPQVPPVGYKRAIGAYMGVFSSKRCSSSAAVLNIESH